MVFLLLNLSLSFSGARLTPIFFAHPHFLYDTLLKYLKQSSFRFFCPLVLQSFRPSILQSFSPSVPSPGVLQFFSPPVLLFLRPQVRKTWSTIVPSNYGLALGNHSSTLWPFSRGHYIRLLDKMGGRYAFGCRVDSVDPCLTLCSLLCSLVVTKGRPEADFYCSAHPVFTWATCLYPLLSLFSATSVIRFLQC